MSDRSLTLSNSSVVKQQSSVSWLERAPAVTFLGSRHNEVQVPALSPFPARNCDTQMKQLDERHGMKLAIDRPLAWLIDLVLPFRAKAG